MLRFFFSTEAEKINAKVHLHHDGKWGYVIYRTTYSDDAQWASFVERLTEFVSSHWDRQPKFDLVRGSFGWDIRDDKEALDGASKAEVRKLFVEWRHSINGRCDLPKYTNCIYADQEVVDAVLNGGDPKTENFHAILNPTAFVKVLDDQFVDDTEQYDADIYDSECESDEETRNKIKKEHHRFPSIEGCDRQNVGWMKIAAAGLAPRAYALLMDRGWMTAYGRPPVIVND